MALMCQDGGRGWQIDLTLWLHDLHDNVTRLGVEPRGRQLRSVGGLRLLE